MWRACLAGGTFTARASIDPGRSVQVEVEDKGGPWISPMADPDRYHGLDIIRALATDWGITGDHIARAAWGPLHLAGQGLAQQQAPKQAPIEA